MLNKIAYYLSLQNNEYSVPIHLEEGHGGIGGLEGRPAGIGGLEEGSDGIGQGGLRPRRKYHIHAYYMEEQRGERQREKRNRKYDDYPNLRSGSIFVSLGETFRRERRNEK